MQRFRLTGPYQPPVPLVFVLRARHVDVIYVEPPRLRLFTQANWTAADAASSATVAAFRSVPPQEARLLLGHRQAPGRDGAAGSAWGAGTPSDRGQGEAWSVAEPLSAAPAVSPWSVPGVRDAGRVLNWQHAIPLDQLNARLSWQVGIPTDTGVASRHRDTDRYGAEWRYIEQLPPYLPGAQPLAFRFNGAVYQPKRNPPVYFSLGRSLRERPTQPRDQRVGIRHGQPEVLDLGRLLPWGLGTPADATPVGIKYPDYNGPVIIIEPAVEPDILETYMIGNTVTLVVLPERTPLDASNIKVRLDIDSYSWAFSADLQGQTSLNLVRPDAAGQKSVELEINGWKWVLLIERYSRQQKFPAERYSITGATRSQLLAAPYAPARSAVNAVAITARQAAEDQLQYTGYTLAWDSANNNPPDWTLPAGALSYQDQTAMQVIARLAEAVGGVVRPSREADAVTVLPRYREPVWAWSSAIMDRIIPVDIVTSLGGEWTPQPAWNSCYVSGTNYGVAVDVRRAGTAGDNPAPDVYDDLLTDTAANRQRGMCELSKGGNQEVVSIAIPLFQQGDTGKPGLVEPAMICEVREVAETWRGLCLSTEISAEGIGAARVQQTLNFERHTGGGY